MIKEIYVDGYRSLTHITIPLEAGLNILVGPNGGGKTNILSFVEFLSKLSDLQVDEAVSSHGGIGRVFRRREENQYDTSFTAMVRGTLPFYTRGSQRKDLYYTWRFKVSSSETYDEIQYATQRLYISIGKPPKSPDDSDLILGTRRTDEGTSLKIEKMIISRLQHFFKGMYHVDASEYFPYSHAASFFRYASRTYDLSKSCILSVFSPQMTLIRRISEDLSGREIFNIAPEICKQPEDSSRPPVMDKNGAGLASVLYNLQKPETLRYRPRRRRRYAQPLMKLRKISSYVSLISPSVSGLTTEKNPIDNTISVFIGIEGESEELVRFPLAQGSDGTVKWIALLTKVITSEQGFSIEEPENFLHPNVQKEFVNLVRTESQHNETLPYTLITTHSESLLNEASPSEVILVWMENGKTVAKRVQNAKELVNEINRTGFGLGYYYTSGALESA